MFEKAIFARRAGHPATVTPSSELQLGPTVSSPSPFTRKLRKLKQVFKRSSSREQDAPQSIAHPRQDSQAPAHPRQDLKPMTRPSQGPSAMTQRDVASFDHRPYGPYLGLPPVLSPSPLFQPGEDILATSTRSTTSRRTFSRNPSPLAPPQSVATAPTTVRSPRPSRRFQPEEEVPTASTQSTTSRRTFPRNPSPLAPPRSIATAPTTVRSHRSSRPFQPEEEISATSTPLTTSRPTFSHNPSLLLAPPRSVATAPTSVRSHRSSRPFQPEEKFSAISTASTTSRLTLSPNPSILLTPPQSFDAAPTTVCSPLPSPLLRPGEETTATSTASTTPCPSLSPTPSLLLVRPQSGDTTPTTIYSQDSPTFQDSEATIDDPATAQNIAELRATIAELQNRRDNYLDGIQRELVTRICPGVRVFQKQRDDQVAALERAKEELAKKVEAKEEMDKLWRDQREERWQVHEAALALNAERKEKEQRCRELTLETFRLEFQQEQWVERGWRRRDWISDSESYSEHTSGASAEQSSASPAPYRPLSYGGGDLENGQAQGARSTAAISTKWAKVGQFAVAAHRRPTTQSSDSISYETMEEFTGARHPTRTSGPVRGTLDEFGRQTEGSGSRGGSDD